jgi:hypothetical protein
MPVPIVDFTGIGENATDIVLRLKEFPARTANRHCISEIRLEARWPQKFSAAKWGLRTGMSVAGSDHNAEMQFKPNCVRRVESHLQRARGREPASYISWWSKQPAADSLAIGTAVSAGPLVPEEGVVSALPLAHVDGESPIPPGKRQSGLAKREFRSCAISTFSATSCFFSAPGGFPGTRSVLGPLGG